MASEGAHNGHRVAQSLREHGVGTVFALPGEHVLHLLDGCLESGIRVIDTRHEGAAALAAEGWALATRQPGVAVVTAGPGFANALIGLLDAGVWSLPLVLVGGRTAVERSGRGAVMDVEQQAVAAPVAKRTIRCVDPARVGVAVTEALSVATSGRPGPVYLEIPEDVLSHAAEEATDLDAAGHPLPPPLPAADPDDLDRALELLEQAERPVAVAGSGAFWSGAGGAIKELVEAAGIPVTTTSAARGVLPDSHEWCLGTLVHAGAALLAADVVLVLGSAFNANLAFGRQPLFNPQQTVIQVDIDPGRLGGNRLPDVALVGDVGRVCGALAEAWRKDAEGRRDWLVEATAVVRHMRASWDRQIEAHRGDAIHAGAVAREVAAVARELAGGEVTFVLDGGDALAWGLAYTDAEAPGRLLTTTTALGSLGVGMPFALAAKAARPDEPTILFTGEGAFGLTAMELETAVRHDLPVVVVVSNNGWWGDVGHAQDRWFGEGRRVGSELRSATRYDLLAEALGGHGERVERWAELRPALERAMAAGVPAVVDVVTDPAVLSDLLRNLDDLDLM